MDRDLLNVYPQWCWAPPKVCKINILFSKYRFCSQHAKFNNEGAVKNVPFSDTVINIFNGIFDNSLFQASVRMQIPSVMTKGKLLRRWLARQINRSFLGITGKRESAKYIGGTVEMAVVVLQWHSRICLLPQRCELLGSNLHPWNRRSVILEFPAVTVTAHSLPRGFERIPCKNVAYATSLKYFYWINAVFKRLPSVFPMETSTSNSSVFVAYRNTRRITRFTISLSPSWGCFFSIIVFMLPDWKMRNKYIETSEQKKPWDGFSAQVWCLTVIVISGAVLIDIVSDSGQDSGWLLWLIIDSLKSCFWMCLIF